MWLSTAVPRPPTASAAGSPPSMTAWRTSTASRRTRSPPRQGQLALPMHHVCTYGVKYLRVGMKYQWGRYIGGCTVKQPRLIASLSIRVLSCACRRLERLGDVLLLEHDAFAGPHWEAAQHGKPRSLTTSIPVLKTAQVTQAKQTSPDVRGLEDISHEKPGPWCKVPVTTGRPALTSEPPTVSHAVDYRAVAAAVPPVPSHAGRPPCARRVQHHAPVPGLHTTSTTHRLTVAGSSTGLLTQTSRLRFIRSASSTRSSMTPPPRLRPGPARPDG